MRDPCVSVVVYRLMIWLLVVEKGFDYSEGYFDDCLG